MNNDQREIRRKLRILVHADRIGDVSKTCRYFGIGRASFYRWRHAYQGNGEAGLNNARPVPHNYPNKTPPEVVEKVLHLRSKYPLGPIRIMWYLERYHGIKLSDAGVYRILKRNGLNRLREFDTPISNRAPRNSMAKSSDHTGQTNRNSANFSATRTTSIWRPS